MSQIRLIELFAGYGSQAMALKRCGISFEHHRVVEVVPWVVDTYNKIHHTDFKPIDIKEMKGSDLGIHHTDKYTYLMFYSFPCTDLSTCGEMKGMSRGSGTRSGLLWEVERLLKECDELPQILMMENVTQVHGCRNIDDFNEWIAFLNSLGYSSKWQDLNAADYGVPQIRNRTFMVSFLDRKRDFVFPQKIRLEKTLRDLLEDDVGEKYFLSQKMVDYVCATGTKSFHYIPDVDLEIARPVTSSMHKMHRASTDTYISEGFCKYGIKASIKDGSLFYTVSFTRKGRLHETDKANTLTARTPTASLGNFTPITGVLYQEEKPRIRKLTPLEALRLMGVNEEDAAVIKSANSDTRCYMMAGNSIVVDVLVHIFRQIFEPDLTEITEPHQIDIFEYLRQENIYE